MSILVDPPAWPARGQMWSHLVSDSSLAELHAFAARLGVPRQAFDRDHYDLPAAAYGRAVAAGAEPVGSRELLARLVAAGMRARRIGTAGRRRPGQLLMPTPRLRPGDTVAVVATSGPVPPDRLQRGMDVLRGWGLRVRPARHLFGQHHELAHLAADDEQRCSDLQAAWTDPGIQAVWCARGGYGAHRIVDRLDHTAMAAVPPRLLIGFSDATAVHEVVNGGLGTISVHGPVVTSLGNAPPECRDALHRLLFEPTRALVLFTGTRLRELVPGTATGVLVGGNLRVLTASIGTSASRPARNGIVLLEDVGEQAYRIDGMLTQLLRSGWFDGARGVVAGAFTDTGGSSADVDTVLADRLGGLDVPVVAGAPVGHIDDNRPVPLGAEAVLDTGSGTLQLTRPALA